MLLTKFQSNQTYSSGGDVILRISRYFGNWNGTNLAVLNLHDAPSDMWLGKYCFKNFKMVAIWRLSWILECNNLSFSESVSPMLHTRFSFNWISHEQVHLSLT